MHHDRRLSLFLSLEQVHTELGKVLDGENKVSYRHQHYHQARPSSCGSSHSCVNYPHKSCVYADPRRW